MTSKGEGQQAYAITVKIPAILVAIRKLIPEIGENETLTFRGKLLAEDKAIVYDVTAGEPIKRRAKRKSAETESNPGSDTELASEGSATEDE